MTRIDGAGYVKDVIAFKNDLLVDVREGWAVCERLSSRSLIDRDEEFAGKIFEPSDGVWAEQDVRTRNVRGRRGG
ncbi:MAG: hypothetical protein IID39_02225 [Planctomycetes bacterium]|nr:hypothetical protein [Planctomycetota bacterium]